MKPIQQTINEAGSQGKLARRLSVRPEQIIRWKKLNAFVADNGDVWVKSSYNAEGKKDENK